MNSHSAPCCAILGTQWAWDTAWPGAQARSLVLAASLSGHVQASVFRAVLVPGEVLGDPDMSPVSEAQAPVVGFGVSILGCSPGG